MNDKYLLKAMMLVQDKYTTLGTYAWSEKYLHVHMQNDDVLMSMLLSKENAELLRDTLDVFLEGGYTSDDVDMWVQYECTDLSTCACNEEYLHMHMNNDYVRLTILLSKQNAELLRDTLDVFLEGGYTNE